MEPVRTLACLLVAAAMCVPELRAQDTVTIYRCTDAAGKVSIRDTPCAKGQAQTRREMVKPVDAPRPARLDPVEVRAPANPPAPRYVFVQPPRPLYECTTPDGERYTSDSPEGNPRWMPLWALDYPVLAERHVYRPGSTRLRVRDGNVDVRIDGGGTRRRVVPTVAAYGPVGTWVRDACHALPQAEACDRLRDRRDELRRQAFNAQPSDRVVIEREERGINARLSSDCGG